jgi:hypothetical protein
MREVISLLPQLGSEIGQSTMQCHTHGALAHGKPRSGRLDRNALQGDRLQHIALTSWQALQMRDEFAGWNSLRDGFAGDCFGEIVDIDEDSQPRRRSASTSLLRAIANNHGENRASGSQV